MENAHSPDIDNKIVATNTKMKAEMLKGGVIMVVTSVSQARLAEDAGAIAVMVMDKIHHVSHAKNEDVLRMSNPKLVTNIKLSLAIPVVAKCRIGHYVEAQILEAAGVDFIYESEVLTPADGHYHIKKKNFNTPFICGAADLGEALRRIGEGASLIRTKGGTGTGNIFETVKNFRTINKQISEVVHAGEEELMTIAERLSAPYELVCKVKQIRSLPVPNFAAGGIATPADAAMMMQLGAETIFVGSGIFKSSDPVSYAKAMVRATACYDDPYILLEVSGSLYGSAQRADIPYGDDQQDAQE
jgi:pyridoxal 5'-phosphate synthase pdxS subunit